MNAFADQPHRRFNPLTGEWVLVSPHRAKRPWQGQTERPMPPGGLEHDPQCYLCAGNRRAGGKRNPDYTTTFVFDNDFPALVCDATSQRDDDDGLLVAEGEAGICRVLCFSPRHDLTLARMSPEAIGAVVEAWIAQYVELGSRPEIGHVQIFENRGEMMGCSNPHPHCQIWASRHLPNEVAKEAACQLAYFERHGRPLLGDYLEKELKYDERLVYENSGFVVLVPYWATWPFETMILPRRRIGGMDEMTEKEGRELADALSNITVKYDNIFQTSFPYSMGFHQKPTDGAPHREWVFHAHFYPPLLRSASVRKFMVGFEMLGMPQRDMPPEEAARRLRGLPSRHYLDR